MSLILPAQSLVVPAAPLILIPPAPTGYVLATPSSRLYVPIVQTAFTTLLSPGRLHFVMDYDLELSEVEKKDEMAIVHPDTSEIPIWRRKPTRVEHPIEAWRVWGLEKEAGKWYLTSVAADCTWEGPVLRAHKRPVDPAYWDAKRSAKNTPQGYEEYYGKMHETFSLAGIWAVKTEEQAVKTARLYQVSCYGKVSLWGRVAQFKLGYRAECCMIKELRLLPTIGYVFDARNDQRDYVKVYSRADIPRIVHHKIAELVRDLQQRYGCEVILL